MQLCRTWSPHCFNFNNNSDEKLVGNLDRRVYRESDSIKTLKLSSGRALKRELSAFLQPYCEDERKSKITQIKFFPSQSLNWLFFQIKVPDLFIISQPKILTSLQLNFQKSCQDLSLQHFSSFLDLFYQRMLKMVTVDLDKCNNLLSQRFTKGLSTNTASNRPTSHKRMVLCHFSSTLEVSFQLPIIIIDYMSCVINLIL